MPAKAKMGSGEDIFYERTTTPVCSEDGTASVPSVVKTRGLGTRLVEDRK